jgi:hypothetical protein
MEDYPPADKNALRRLKKNLPPLSHHHHSSENFLKKIPFLCAFFLDNPLIRYKDSRPNSILTKPTTNSAACAE